MISFITFCGGVIAGFILCCLMVAGDTDDKE